MTYRAAIIDLDGTVYVGYDLIDGVEGGLQALRDAGLDLLFFSNNPIMDGEEYVTFLQGLGLEVRDGEAISSADVTLAQLKEQHADELIFPVASEDFRDQLEAAGLQVTEDPAAADVLVASWTVEFDYHDMREALVAMDEDTSFYGTDPDRTFQMGEDEVVPGSGAIISSIAATVDADPDAILGKPSTASLQYAIDQLGCEPSECLIIGDRLDTDLRMGDRAGMESVLVLTGVTDRERLERSDHQPDHVIDSLADIEEVLAALELA